MQAYERTSPVANARRWLLILIWGTTALAILPAVFHWVPRPPHTGPDRYLRIGFGYLVAFAIFYRIYRVELQRLSRSQTRILVILLFLLASIVNNLHNANVDHASNVFGYPNWIWQIKMHDLIMQLSPSVLPHSYRFLPNSVVGWMQLARIDYESARDLYRLIFGILLFYAIYRYARLYTNYAGAIVAILLIALIYPISFEHYAGQLTDPLSHLSFVLAFFFLETEDFALLLSTLIIGSLAKETVLAMTGYYVLFCRKERNYFLKAITLCVASATAYYGVRLLVLKGNMHYGQVSGVTLDHLLENWRDMQWPPLFLLTVGALMPFLALGWKKTPLSLKRQAFFLLPVLFISSLFFSWLRESRNFMPLVFVLAVSAGNYVSPYFTEGRQPELLQKS